MTDQELEKINRCIAKELRSIRKSQGKTQEQVAYDLGLSGSYLGSIELGKRTKISTLMYLKLADYYGIAFSKVVEVAEAKASIDGIYK